MKKFNGTFDQLSDLVSLTGIDGSWSDLGNQKQFRTVGGAVLNWWQSSKTVNFQGDPEETETLRQALIEVEGRGTVARSASRATPQKANTANNKVFVVYGHDEKARHELDAMLRRWGLEPLILDQLPSKGQTIIEKLEEYTSDVGFGVVLATPDDQGHRRDREDEKSYRARQNVVLELGMLLTKLGREKVAVLLKDQEKMERPSDIQGLIYIPFKDNLQKDAGALLAKEMAAQGYSIDIRNL
jgi:predicted nucleotide-binding protein